MAAEVQMPKLGATMEKGTIIEWLKDEGDAVELGEPIVEIMTDKINIEVEATGSGVLLKKLFETDTEVPVFEPIAYVGEPGEKVEEQPKAAAGKTADLRMNNELQEKSESFTQEVNAETKIRRTPAALKLANKHGIDISKIKGSGPHNRIHIIDVEKYLSKNEKIKTPLAEKIAKDYKIDTAKISTDKQRILKEDILRELTLQAQSVINYKGIRKIVGDRMALSAKTVPHVTLNSEVDMTKAIEIRGLLLDKIKKQTGHRLSITEIIVKCVAHALKANPLLNASLNGNQINLYSDINIGLAVAIPNGLVVPVIKQADQKGFAELTNISKKLVKSARENRLTSDELSGGTFTISNLGMYAVDSFTPIINQPESGILGVGRIREQVVSVNGAIEVRPQMALSLSFDHRVIDGAPAAQFLTDVKNILENPYELLS